MNDVHWHHAQDAREASTTGLVCERAVVGSGQDPNQDCREWNPANSSQEARTLIPKIALVTMLEESAAGSRAVPRPAGRRCRIRLAARLRADGTMGKSFCQKKTPLAYGRIERNSPWLEPGRADIVGSDARQISS